MLKKILAVFSISVLGFASNIDKVKIYTENYPPYNLEEHGKLKGISVDLLVEMFKRMGSKKTIKDIKLVPWSRGYKLTLNKKNTMLFSTTRTEQREKLFKWVGPIIDTKVGLIGLANKNYQINSVKDLNKYKIGAVINDIGEQLLISNGVNKKNIKSISGKNPVSKNFQKMIRGRIDLVAYEVNVAYYMAKNLNHKFKTYYILKKGQLYYAFNKNTDDKIIKAYQKALDEIKKDGTYDKILKKYK